MDGAQRSIDNGYWKLWHYRLGDGEQQAILGGFLVIILPTSVFVSMFLSLSNLFDVFNSSIMEASAGLKINIWAPFDT